MKTILKQFIDEPLFDACAAMLGHLHIAFNQVTRTPVSFDSLYPAPLTKALNEICGKVAHTYFIGTVDEASFSGHAMQQDKEVFIRQAYEGRYTSMMIFAVDISTGHTLTRSEMAILTRGFNRIASAQPVILFIKQGKRLALATCERSEYTQQWRDGEKLGKVSILRDINCLDPHRGHLDILNSIGSKACSTFEELYKHWMQVFSNELLTKKFYGELSDWYAWAVQVVRFPNDLATKDDDEKFNHESCIRLITRLIFVWFLKQKHLIPEEFFDERYIKEHFIEEFNPHDRENLMYNPEKSRYYRLILQNLFFAMLNRPIVPEGKNIADNRRFRAKGSYHGMNQDYAVNNLMRYESEFMHGGAEEFMEMANSHVPFLNGGLFDCLDDKSNNLYYDGFSERMESLEQLYLPDWLFFGDEVGCSIDLSEWYGDTKKKKVSAQGIIDILKRYNFTIEENTPLDQEVSLDPELLGKAFENLLASYNPETKTSARKQTGSFYTPREIVQYMVDESLVAHLKRTCGEELEAEYRSLLSYATEETTLNEEQRRQVMQALYHCRVLDPACGSGAFPMGILQQMVHILRQLDPTNEMWKEFMRDIAVEQSRKAYSSDENEEREARLRDIDEAFDKSINDPDYARKLYLIEHCIFGVDIQPIAVQISKLRFFISLVVDQKPTNDAVYNFGIRPLPNLESKFVAANTLIPVDYDASLFESTDDIIAKKEQLKELNHQIFLAKRNIDKQRLKTKIKETRKALAKAIENTGFVNPGAAQQLADWDMFEQNTSSPFFDAEWMFGVKGGFDIVIGNPPYVFARNSKEKGITQRLKKFYKQHYKLAKYQVNLYHLFVEKGANLLKPNGIFAYIIPNNWLTINTNVALRQFVLSKSKIQVVNFYKKVFESADVDSSILLFEDSDTKHSVSLFEAVEKELIELIITTDCQSLLNTKDCIINIDIFKNKTYYDIIEKIESMSLPLNEIALIKAGLQAYEIGKGTPLCTKEMKENRIYHSMEKLDDSYFKYLQGADVCRYKICWSGEYLKYGKNLAAPRKFSLFSAPRILVRQIPSKLPYCINACYLEDVILNDRNSMNIIEFKMSALYILGLINSKLMSFWFVHKFGKMQRGLFPQFKINELGIFPIAKATDKEIVVVSDAVTRKMKGEDAITLDDSIDLIVYKLYDLTYDEAKIIDPEIPITREEYGKIDL